MIRKSFLESSTRAGTLIALAVFALGFVAARAAGPLTSATVTKLENAVKYGETRGERSITRAAKVSDVVRSNNFLLTETDSRAELQYEDGTVVRVGQNTVFSFDANTRSLTLEKGSFIFYMPKGAGGGQIKTPSLTAAITGTVGKVSSSTIAILDGEITLKPSGQIVHAGEFARRNPDGTITIAKFDPAAAGEGKLMSFHGKMPGFDESKLLPPSKTPNFSGADLFETLDRTQNSNSAIHQFNPDRPRDRVRVPKPQNDQSQNPPY